VLQLPHAQLQPVAAPQHICCCRILVADGWGSPLLLLWLLTGLWCPLLLLLLL
jgi:hypothetical protein